MHPIAESEAKVVHKEPIFVDQFLILFIREARKEDNTTSECVRTVGATYVCKILQLYKYVANEGNRYEANCESHQKNASLCSINERRLSG